MTKEKTKNVYWMYSILVEDDFSLTRDELIVKLKENGVQSRPFFMPIHDMPPYEECKHGDMSITNEIAEKGMNLPSSVGLPKEDIERICNVIGSCCKY